MQKRMRDLEEERNSVNDIKSQLLKDSKEEKHNHDKETQRLEEEFDIVKKDMELKFKEELLCEKVGTVEEEEKIHNLLLLEVKGPGRGSKIL